MGKDCHNIAENEHNMSQISQKSAKICVKVVKFWKRGPRSLFEAGPHSVAAPIMSYMSILCIKNSF